MSSTKGKASRMMSVGLFAALWFTVCAATAAAAIEFPINRLLRMGGEPGDAPSENIYADNGLPGDMGNRVGTVYERYRNSRLREIMDSMPRLADREAESKVPQGSTRREMFAPIDAVCRFVADRKTDELFKAVHPGLARYLKENFGAAIELFGGSDAVLEPIVEHMLGDEAAAMLGARTVRYDVVSIQNCDDAELRRIEENARLWDTNLKVLEAVRVELRLTIMTESAESDNLTGSDGSAEWPAQGSIHASCSPIVFRTAEGWFIDVDISSFGG